jgi:hypothetical protein
MSRFLVALTLALLTSLVLSGCTGSDEPAVRAEPEPEPLDEETAEVAASRGVAEKVQDDDANEAIPQVLLTELTYEWRTVPENGLQVTLEFTNPVRTYERARGYVFLIASAGSRVRSVYPWNTTIVEGLPEDYTDGTHLLYRDRQEVRALIPYPGSSGYFETLRLLVFHENGRLLTNRTYDLNITGVPGESKTINPGFDL